MYELFAFAETLNPVIQGILSGLVAFLAIFFISFVLLVVDWCKSSIRRIKNAKRKLKQNYRFTKQGF